MYANRLYLSFRFTRRVKKLKKKWCFVFNVLSKANRLTKTNQWKTGRRIK